MNRCAHGLCHCAAPFHGSRWNVSAMASLLNLLDVSLSFGGPPVLAKVNFQIDPGERVCLVGRNGAGKSTLMRGIVG